MGGCASKSNKKFKSHKKYFHRGIKSRRKISSSTVVAPIVGCLSDAVICESDLGRSEFVHDDFRKCTTTTGSISEPSNLSINLTQMQWNRSQVDANGTFILSSSLQAKFLISQKFII